jgi:hypothetical protein
LFLPSLNKLASASVQMDAREFNHRLSVGGWDVTLVGRIGTTDLGQALDWFVMHGLKDSGVQSMASLLKLAADYVRSVGLGPEEPPLSVVVDDLGIYYDASAPSRLERLIGTPLSAAERQRAGALAEAWRRQRLSKYNGALESTPPQEPFVLVLVPPSIQGLGVAGGFQMQVEDREGVGANVLQERTQAIIDEAHQICPYSNATRDNIKLTLTILDS